MANIVTTDGVSIVGLFQADVLLDIAGAEKSAAADYQWAVENRFQLAAINVLSERLEFAPGEQSMLMARLLATSDAGGILMRAAPLDVNTDKRTKDIVKYVPAFKVIFEFIGPAGKAIQKVFAPNYDVQVIVLTPFTKTDADMFAKVGLPRFGSDGKGNGLMAFGESGGGLTLKRKTVYQAGLVRGTFDPAKLLNFRIKLPPPNRMFWFLDKLTDSDTPRLGTGVDDGPGGPPPVPVGSSVDPSVAAKAAGQAAGKALREAPNKPLKLNIGKRIDGQLVPMFLVGALAVGGLLLLGRKKR